MSSKMVDGLQFIRPARPSVFAREIVRRRRCWCRAVLSCARRAPRAGPGQPLWSRPRALPTFPSGGDNLESPEIATNCARCKQVPPLVTIATF